MKKLLGVLLSIALLIPALVQADPTVDLRYAIDNGDVQGVKNAISQNASVNANSPYGDSIIAWARKKGNQEIVSLLQERINFLAKSKENNVNLLNAAWNGNLEGVKQALAAGAQIEAKAISFGNLTAYQLAIRGRHTAVATYLQEHGAK